MEKLPNVTYIHLHPFLGIKEKGMLYKSFRPNNRCFVLISITEIKYKYSRNLTNDILKQKRFTFLKKMCLHCNKHVTTLNRFAKTLKEIDISFGIVNDEGISQCIFLEKINILNNYEITNINHLKCLKELYYGDAIKLKHDELTLIKKIKHENYKTIMSRNGNLILCLNVYLPPFEED